MRLILCTPACPNPIFHHNGCAGAGKWCGFHDLSAKTVVLFRKAASGLRLPGDRAAWGGAVKLKPAKRAYQAWRRCCPFAAGPLGAQPASAPPPNRSPDLRSLRNCPRRRRPGSGAGRPFLGVTEVQYRPLTSQGGGGAARSRSPSPRAMKPLKLQAPIPSRRMAGASTSADTEHPAGPWANTSRTVFRTPAP